MIVMVGSWKVEPVAFPEVRELTAAPTNQITRTANVIGIAIRQFTR